MHPFIPYYCGLLTLRGSVARSAIYPRWKTVIQPNSRVETFTSGPSALRRLTLSSPGFSQLLAPDETARAARFHFDHLQRRFILSRGALRILLGHYLDIAANRIEFRYGSRGKPSLAAPAGIHFNASHSGDVALFAFTLHCEIGVDVEEMRPISDMREIASRFFCAEESTELMALPADERERAFFLCWTRKEAYLKAVGEGLYAPLNDFCVTLRPGEPA